MNALGEKLRLLRLQRHWTQRELAERSGISTPHISSMERGKRRPSFLYAERLAAAFKVPLEYFCDYHQTMSLENLLPVAKSFSPTLHRLILNESNGEYASLAESIKSLDEDSRRVVGALIETLARKSD